MYHYGTITYHQGTTTVHYGTIVVPLKSPQRIWLCTPPAPTKKSITQTKHSLAVLHCSLFFNDACPATRGTCCCCEHSGSCVDATTEQEHARSMLRAPGRTINVTGGRTIVFLLVVCKFSQVWPSIKWLKSQHGDVNMKSK